MKFGIVVMAEPLTLDGSRPYRAGMLADAMADAGHEVTWWTSTFDHSRKSHRHPTHHTVQLRPGVELRMLHGPAYGKNVSLARVRHNRSVARSLAQGWRANDPDLDLLFVCIPLHELAKVALDFRRQSSVPVVLDVRDPWPDVYLQLVPAQLRPVLRQALIVAYRRASKNFREADAIVAVSDAYLEWAVALGRRPPNPWDRTFPIGYPAPSLGAPTQGGSRGNDFVVAFVGTFGAGYDLDTVVAAARQLADRLPNVRFVLAGDGDERERLVRLAAGARNIDFPGWLTQDGVARLLREAAVGLVAYRGDAVQTMPNKPFEYWAAGLPVLSSLTGELAAIVADERVGLPYRAGDVESLTAAVTWLVDHEVERVEMARRARALFDDRYSASAIYPRLVQHLEGIAAASRTGEGRV